MAVRCELIRPLTLVPGQEEQVEVAANRIIKTGSIIQDYSSRVQGLEI